MPISLESLWTEIPRIEKVGTDCRFASPLTDQAKKHEMVVLVIIMERKGRPIQNGNYKSATPLAPRTEVITIGF